MIITCKSCKTSYNLDQGLLKPTGSKVRCSKCNYTFIGYPPATKRILDLSNPELDFGKKVELLKITDKKKSQLNATETSLDPNKVKKSFIATSITSAKTLPSTNIAEDESNDFPNIDDLIDFDGILTAEQKRCETTDEFELNEGRKPQTIVNLEMTDYADLLDISDLEKISEWDGVTVSEKNIEAEQASYARPRGEMMSTNSLKKKPKTKIWIPAVASALILIVLIIGCYQKINDGGNPYFVSQAEQSITLSGKDLNKFGSSVKVIDGQAQSHYKMALYFQRRKKHRLAIEELKDAVQLSPLFVKAYNAMGVSYDNLGRYSQAIGCYQSALKLDPKLDYVHNNLGYSYLLKNELDAAIVAFQKAIELNDNNKRYRNNLGLAYVMKDQYDKAYEQFKIIEDDTGAKEKLARLLDKLGKEKPDQYLAKESNSGRTRKKSERKTPVVIRRKIKDKEPQSLIKTDTTAQKSKDQEIKDEQFSPSDKKAFLNPDKDIPPLDETDTSTGNSRAALAKNPEINDPKKVKSLGSIVKEGHRELQTESNQSDQPTPCEFCEKDTAESDLAAIDTNPIQIITAENQKPSNLSEKPAAEIKADIHEATESLDSSDPLYYISAVELVPDPVSEKKAFNESVKAKTFGYEDANRVQNTFEPKVIEVEESYYPDAKETATVAPARSKKTKTDLIGSDKKVLEKKQPLAYAEAVPTITSTDKKIDRKTFQGKSSQWNESLNLADKETDLKENSKSEDITVEIEIEVANGNGVNGAAGRFGTYLKSKGLKVAKVANANSFDHATTKIFYCNGDKEDVYKLLQQIPFVLNQRSIIELKNLKNRFKIIIGKDQVKHDKIISRSINRKRKS